MIESPINPSPACWGTPGPCESPPGWAVPPCSVLSRGCCALFAKIPIWQNFWQLWGPKPGSGRRRAHCYLSQCVFVLVGNAVSNLCHVYLYPESFGNFSHLLALPVLNTAPRTRCFLLRWWSRAGVLAQEEQVISDTSLAQAPPASPPLSFVPLKHKHT